MRRWMAGLGVLAMLAWGCHPPVPEAQEGGGGGAARQPAQGLSLSNPDGIADLVDATEAAVINIDTVARREHPRVEGLERQFGQGGIVARGVGSGFIVRDDGLIVTNYHVVAGANQLNVTMHDGQRYDGKLMASDPVTDLALVRIGARGLPTLKLGDADELRVGQWVVAMGSPLGLQHSVTLGILSAINRDISLNERVGFLQVDAPINPGNSGGPLLNLAGEVIGVNTAVAAEAQGIGFAIPVDTLERVITQLERTGKVVHPWLGVGIANLPADTAMRPGAPDAGVLVGRVEPGSPAARAGVKPGDVIVSVGGSAIDSASALVRRVDEQKVGERVSIGVYRDGRTRELTARLEAMPQRLKAR